MVKSFRQLGEEHKQIKCMQYKHWYFLITDFIKTGAYRGCLWVFWVSDSVFLVFWWIFVQQFVQIYASMYKFMKNIFLWVKENTKIRHHLSNLKKKKKYNAGILSFSRQWVTWTWILFTFLIKYYQSWHMHKHDVFHSWFTPMFKTLKVSAHTCIFRTRVHLDFVINKLWAERPDISSSGCSFYW